MTTSERERARVATTLAGRLLSLTHVLKLDRIAYRLWRYNPVALVKLYRHYAFDRRFGVTTRGYGDLRYEPTPESVFERLVGALPADLSQFAFVDIGSGKGKALFLAARFPFRRVIGVELFEDLHRTAETNLEAYDGPGATRIELVLTDAATYPLPNEPVIVYLFNPFAEEILEKVLSNVEASIEENPRPVYVLFYAPIVRRGTPWDRRRPFDDSPRLRVVHSERDFTLYEGMSAEFPTHR